MRQITCPVCSVPPQSIPSAHSRVRCNSCQVDWTYLPEDTNIEALYRDEVYEVIDNRRSIFEKIIFYEAKKILNNTPVITISGSRNMWIMAQEKIKLTTLNVADWPG